MISCTVLQEIPTYGLRACPSWKCLWSCCSLLPRIHHRVPPVIDLALRCMYGLCITNLGCAGKFRARLCSSPLPAHSVLLCSPLAISRVPPTAVAPMAAPSPSPPHQEKNAALQNQGKNKAEKSSFVLFSFLGHFELIKECDLNYKYPPSRMIYGLFVLDWYVLNL